MDINTVSTSSYCRSAIDKMGKSFFIYASENLYMIAYTCMYALIVIFLNIYRWYIKGNAHSNSKSVLRDDKLWWLAN